jgi:hypothetical protein
MKRFFALLIGFACAAACAQPSVPCLRLSRVAIANHSLRQQEDTVVTLTFKARNCAVAELRDRTTAAFESSPGLDIALSDVGFKDLDDTRTSTGIQKARELSLSLKLSASPDLAVGEHTLHGLLSYQVIDASGNPTPETLAIGFPFKVAPYKPYEKVALPDNGRPHQESAFVHGLKIAGMIVVGIPLFIVLAVLCLTTGNCWEC